MKKQKVKKFNLSHNGKSVEAKGKEVIVKAEDKKGEETHLYGGLLFGFSRKENLLNGRFKF